MGSGKCIYNLCKKNLNGRENSLDQAVRGNNIKCTLIKQCEKRLDSNEDKHSYVLL